MKVARELGIAIDAKKFLRWSRRRPLKDVGIEILVMCDALKRKDKSLLKQRYPFITHFISRPSR
jgi:hypothetical protein